MTQKPLARALGVAGAVLVGSVALALGRRAGIIDQEITVRGLMVVIGLGMVVIANDIPKAATTRTARGQALQRFTGRTMVLAYLAWLAIWIFAPMSLATGLAIVPVALAGIWIAVVCFRNRKTVV